MKNMIYSEKDHPSATAKDKMWSQIAKELPHSKGEPQKTTTIHWMSFLLGNAAALLLLFAAIGIMSTANFFDRTLDENQEMYETLNAATTQLHSVTPFLIQQAREQNVSSIESTLTAINEIDRLIEELRNDINLNGNTPVKEQSLRGLYATKLDFYKEILLSQKDQL